MPPAASPSPSAPDPARPALVRALGRWTLTALVINCTIASGIFGLPDDVARLIGTSAPIAYILAALGIGVIIAASAELASQFKSAGGPYVYARAAFGPLTGIETAWFAWLTRVTALAAIANIFVVSLGEFWPGVTAPVPRALILIGIIGLLTVVNILGVKQGAGVNNFFTVAKLAPLALFIVVGLVLAPRAETAAAAASLVPPAATTAQWIDALVILLFAYGGFETVFLAAGEAKNPRRDAPFALFTGLALVTVIYISIHLVTMWSVPDLARSERPLADAARAFAGPVGAGLIALGAACSTFGALSGGVVTAPRLVFALGEQGDLPKVFASVHPRYRTPWVAILFWAVLVLGLALWGNFIWNAILSVAARLVVYSATCASLIRLRRTQPNADAWRAPAGTLLACLGIAFCALLVFRLTALHAAIIASVFVIARINWAVMSCSNRPAPPIA